jgi:2-keto-4-pentenoate hydratase/2-oxohepta-3-ene-1,7-dioic acid hydratase in catechol pathway
MRLLMFRHESERRLGVLLPGDATQVVDVSELARALRAPPPPADLMALIDEGDDGLDHARELLQCVGEATESPVVRPLAELTLLPPLYPRGNVLGIGRNYAKHAQDAARAQSTDVGPPSIFTKAITTVTGPYDDLPIDFSISSEIDWEVELGVVIGRRGINIPPEDSLNHVFGYTVVNDISARNIQHGWGGQWFKGKSLDASFPTGPWVVTRDEIPNAQDLELRLRVNAVSKQEASTRDMIYPVDAIISWLSVGMTLLPGSLIATGSPEGVGFTRTPPEFLAADDVIESEIEGLGILRNRVVAVPQLQPVAQTP